MLFQFRRIIYHVIVYFRSSGENWILPNDMYNLMQQSNVLQLLLPVAIALVSGERSCLSHWDHSPVHYLEDQILTDKEMVIRLAATFFAISNSLFFDAFQNAMKAIWEHCSVYCINVSRSSWRKNSLVKSIRKW